ncbi:MAG: hypothetical protein NT120_00120 [Candidatus Aenigmarchaeota archaeon]|nr:hypothetical protein [Candidatus Aenigmarchaeota archaeon]
MPVITKNGEGDRIPWRPGSGRVVADKPEEVNGVPNVIEWVKGFLEKARDKGESEKKEPVAPPKPEKAGGPYTEAGSYVNGLLKNFSFVYRTEENPVVPEYHEKNIDRLLEGAGARRSTLDEDEITYKLMLEDIRKHGYAVEILPRNEMERRGYNSGAYEDGKMIYLADGLSWKEAKKRLGHEFKAKLERKKNPNFDHERAHENGWFDYNPVTLQGGADLVKAYEMRARLMRN